MPKTADDYYKSTVQVTETTTLALTDETFFETTEPNNQTSEPSSHSLKLSITNTGDENTFVKFQVFLSKHLELLTTTTKQRTQNSRKKRHIEEELENFPSAYNGDNFGPNKVQMTTTAIRLLSNHHLSNEVEFTNIEHSSVVKLNNEVLTIVDLPPNGQVFATISTPNYPSTYPSDSNVAFFIRTSGANSLQLEFTDFDVETSFDSVFVIKVDRQTGEKAFLAFPSKSDDHFVYNSDGKDLLVVMKTDCTGESRGFSGIVKVTESFSSSTVKPHTNWPSLPTVSDDNLPETNQCGDLELVGNGIIRSPWWPDYYPVDSSCSYLITARNNRSIDLEIDVVGIRLDDNYMHDHIILYSGKSDKNPILAVINGYNQSHHFITNTSQVFIKFVSIHDSYFQHGFSIKYKETNDPPLNIPTCGGYVKQSGRVYVPNYENYESIKCEWFLQADIGKKANVHVYHNNLAYNGEITLRNGPDASSSTLEHYWYLDHNQNATYTSDSEYLYVLFNVKSYKEVSGEDFYPYSSSYFEFFETD